MVDIHAPLSSVILSPEKKNRMSFMTSHPCLWLINYKSLQYNWANGQKTSILLQTQTNENIAYVAMSSGLTFLTDSKQMLN